MAAVLLELKTILKRIVPAHSYTVHNVSGKLAKLHEMIQSRIEYHKNQHAQTKNEHAQLKVEHAQMKIEHASLKRDKETLSMAQTRVQKALQEIHSQNCDDTVVLCFPDSNSEDQSIKCSRTLARQWSSAFEAMLRHGNQLGNDFPAQIELKDTEMSAFQAALDFHCSGQFNPDAIPGKTQYEHPLLQLADRYDLQELKKDYIAMALQKVPLSTSTASWHLSLWATVNDTEKKAECIHSLASSFRTGGANVMNQFLELNLEDAKSVLGHDELAIPGGHEHEALGWFCKWVQHQPCRAAQASELFQCVRLSLLKVQQLIDFQDEVTTNASWSDSKKQMCVALRAAMEDKLSVECVGVRKRKASVLTDDDPAEKSLLKTLRITRSMFEPMPPATAHCGAGA